VLQVLQRTFDPTFEVVVFAFDDVLSLAAKNLELTEAEATSKMEDIARQINVMYDLHETAQFLMVPMVMKANNKSLFAEVNCVTLFLTSPVLYSNLYLFGIGKLW